MGLQNFNFNGKKSGYALKDINEKKINQIIEDNEIFYVNFNKEKNILLASMTIRKLFWFDYMVKAYNIIHEQSDKKLNLKHYINIKVNKKEKWYLY